MSEKAKEWLLLLWALMGITGGCLYMIESAIKGIISLGVIR